MSWKGVWVATVTPFRNDKVDILALEKLIDRLLSEGISGFCPCGTTGEGSALEEHEFVTVVETVLKNVSGKVPVVPGTGSNNTVQTLERTRLAKSIGANGALVVTPYYVKPTPDGLVRHYGEVAKANFPIMMYNVPGRTSVNMMPDTVERITSFAEIKAIKECAPIAQVEELVKRVGTKIDIFSGEDPNFLPFLTAGGKGIVSVVSNMIGKEIVQIYDLFSRGDRATAEKQFKSLASIFDIFFIESNPIPVKAALEMREEMTGEVRSPLAPLTEKNVPKLRDELVRRGFLQA